MLQCKYSNTVFSVMYWADAANNRIWRAYMDGTNMTLFRGDMTSPDGLAIILEQNRLACLLLSPVSR